MKLITWNCQGAFRKKYLQVAEIAPDIAVIQECEQLEKIPWKSGREPASMLWFGQNPSRGLAVFSWTGFTFQAVEPADPALRFCVPIRVTTPFQFNLLAVWAMDHKKDAHSYSGQVYQAVSLYREFIQQADTVVMGDFNSSKRTTPKSRIGNHATLTQTLEDLWLVSAYHQFYFEKQGQETRGTFFRSRKQEKVSHIDYAYIPVRWIRRIKNVQAGAPAEWLEHSDHCPVIVEIQPKEGDKIV